MLRLLIVTLSLLLAGPAAARPFTVDDLLALESFGRAQLDPTGRWAVIERREPYGTAPRFDLDQAVSLSLTRLLLADLSRPRPARPLLGPDDPPGQAAGPFSPQGARLALMRLTGAELELGTYDLAAKAARWTGLTPAYGPDLPALAWRDERRLLAIVRRDGLAPWPIRAGFQTAAAAPRLWAAQARGEASALAVGSGDARAIRPQPRAKVLVEIDAVTGGARILASGPFVTLSAAPGGRRVALLEAGEDLQPAAGQPLQGDYGLATVRRRLILLELTTGARRHPCAGLDLLESLQSWSPDGSALLVYGRAPGTPWSQGSLRLVDAAGRCRPAAPAGFRPRLKLRPERLETAWMGRDPLVLAEAPHGRRDWFRLSEGRARNLTSRLPASPDRLLSSDPEGLRLAAAGALWRVTPTGAAARLGEAVPSCPGAPVLVRHPEGPCLIVERDPTGVETLTLANHGHRTVLARANLRLAEVDPPRVRPVLAGPDRRLGWLFLPPAGAGRPAPLIVKPYLGSVYPIPPAPAPPPLGFPADIRVMTGRGYAVLVPDLPRPAAPADPTQGLAERLLAAADAAARAYPLEVDGDRLALWGHSYGGYAVAAALTQTRRFRAAIAVSAPTDLASLWGTFQAPNRTAPEEGVWVAWTAGWTETAQGGMGGPPWTDPERYRRNSPALMAEAIVTPLMIVHGDQDPVPLGQAEELFSALYRQDKDAQLVTYWGEGHYIASPGNVRDLYRRAFAFLDAHLGPPVKP